MRQVLIGICALVAIMSAGIQTSTAAPPRPYCLDAERTHMKDCSYYSFQQCLDTARGLGGICYYNPAILWAQRYGASEPAPRRKAKARRSY
jgi:hypothetical protein